MKKDIEGIIRFIAAYGKGADSQIQSIYYLRNVDLRDLRSIFDINTKETDPGVKDMIDCYCISKQQFDALRKYIDDKDVVFEEGNFYLECGQDSNADWNILSTKYGYYPPPLELKGFPNAISIKPNEKNN